MMDTTCAASLLLLSSVSRGRTPAAAAADSSAIGPGKRAARSAVRTGLDGGKISQPSKVTSTCGARVPGSPAIAPWGQRRRDVLRRAEYGRRRAVPQVAHRHRPVVDEWATSSCLDPCGSLTGQRPLLHILSSPTGCCSLCDRYIE